jgi:hypothetical protein
MNPTIKTLLEQTGFVFWSDYEADHKNSDNIDWSNDYDTELEDFVYALVEKICETVETSNQSNFDLADTIREQYLP